MRTVRAATAGGVRGDIRGAPWEVLFVHEQLAAGAAGSQPTHSRDAPVQHGFTRRLARRVGRALRGVRTLGLPGLAPARPGPGGLSASARRAAHTCPTGLRLVLPCDGAAVPPAGAGGRGVPTLSGRSLQLLRSGSLHLPPLQPCPHLARAALDPLGSDVVSGLGDLPRAAHCRSRAGKSARSGLRAPIWVDSGRCSSRSGCSAG